MREVVLTGRAQQKALLTVCKNTNKVTFNKQATHQKFLHVHLVRQVNADSSIPYAVHRAHASIEA